MPFRLTMAHRTLWLAGAIMIVLAATIVLLRAQGRSWLCSCGEIYFWAGNIHSQHNSQHLFDPYSFTHLLHGLVLFWVLTPAVRRYSVELRIGLAVLAESAWEVFENSSFVIERYRAATIALGYEGDTVINSLTDIAVCTGGFLLANYLGWRRSIALFAAIEIVLIVWIRDSLLLNVVMLIYPIEAIRTWQMAS